MAVLLPGALEASCRRPVALGLCPCCVSRPRKRPRKPGMPEVRSVNILLICGVRLICQLDRLAWSFLVVAMSGELGWNTVEQGHVKAAFASGYLWLQIVGGVAGDRYGNKAFQAFAMLACGVGMALVPALIGAGKLGEPQETDGKGLEPWDALTRQGSSFAVARTVYFLMGLSCGPQHPTGTAMLAKWCLPSEKAWVSSMDALSSIAGQAAFLLHFLEVFSKKM